MSWPSLRYVVSMIFLPAMLLTGADPPPKDLVQYIQAAKELGLADDTIRQNARAAGWGPKLIDDALTAASRGPLPVSNANIPAGYRIGPGDLILVSVWKEPDATQEVTVRSDGKVSLPLVKEVEIAGLSPTDAEKLLSEKFGKLIPGADVTIIVRTINSRKVYLVGAVRTVGPVNMAASLTVLQAIAQAGGLTDYAKKKQIYILRHENGRQVRLPFNYESVIKGERIEQNVVLQPDDTIVVPQ